MENQQPPLRNMEVTWVSGSRNIVKAHVIENNIANII